jgi:hypothetical protein
MIFCSHSPDTEFFRVTPSGLREPKFQDRGANRRIWEITQPGLYVVSGAGHRDGYRLVLEPAAPDELLKYEYCDDRRGTEITILLEHGVSFEDAYDWTRPRTADSR